MIPPLFLIAYLVICFAQFFAIWDGIVYGLGLDNAFGHAIGFILALITTPIPIVGSLLGIYGAVAVWQWHIVLAVALFFWYLPVIAARALLVR